MTEHVADAQQIDVRAFAATVADLVLQKLESSGALAGLAVQEVQHKEAAKLLGVTPATIHNWIKGGKIRRSEGTGKIPMSEIRRLLAARN